MFHVDAIGKQPKFTPANVVIVDMGGGYVHGFLCSFEKMAKRIGWASTKFANKDKAIFDFSISQNKLCKMPRFRNTAEFHDEEYTTSIRIFIR